MQADVPSYAEALSSLGLCRHGVEVGAEGTQLLGSCCSMQRYLGVGCAWRGCQGFLLPPSPQLGFSW